jgi:hypothetical protein
MEYIERIIASLAVLSLIIIGQQYYFKKNIIAKWICYVLAATIWGITVCTLHTNWIEMIISIAGIGLFAWLIVGAINDHRDLRKSR